MAFVLKGENDMKNDVLKLIAQKAKRRLVGKEAVVNAKIKVISNEDEDFKSKVEFLLSQESVVSNPVHYLIDDRILNNMAESQREKYLLDTLDKYNSLKNKLESPVYGRYCM